MSVNPPRNAFPPLNALRAFEAAARLGGISRAAEELSVTPGAVAQQVKLLEEWAGARLFLRHASGVELSALGRRVAGRFETAFDCLAEAVQDLREAAEPQAIRIATLPSLAQLWLAPRMPDLRRKFPNARISVTALEGCPNMRRDGFDLALFLEPGDAAEGIVLARDRILPVCAPQLAGSFRNARDLGRALWLKDTAWPEDWAIWQSGRGVAISPEPETLWFSLYALAVAEAEAGAGLLMGHAVLVEAALQAGRLVTPFDQPVETGNVLSAVCRTGEQRPVVREIIAVLAAPVT